MNKIQVAVLLLLLGLLFGLVSVQIVNTVDFHNTDFFTFWLAGRMTLAGQDVYSEAQWLAGHHLYGATWTPNPIFPYPISLSLFLVPLGLLSLKSAFGLWVFATQVICLVSLYMLTAAWKGLTSVRTYLAVSLFLFRPVLVTLVGGQFVAFFLFVISLVIYLWKREKWFLGGMIISLLNLKPSYGAMILILAGVWLLFRKQKTAIIGIILGNLILGAVGFIQNPKWVQLFLETGRRKFGETAGLYPTIWSMANIACNRNDRCGVFLAGFVILLFVGIYIYLIATRQDEYSDPLGVLALVIPIALLITYDWAYDQIILIVTIVFCVQKMLEYNQLLPRVFPFLVGIFSFLLLAWAYFHGNDVLSFFLPFLLFCSALWFWVFPRQRENVGVAG